MFKRVLSFFNFALVRLREAEEKSVQAERDGKAKTEFLGSVGLELREPVNGIIGSSYLLLRTSLDHKQQQYANKIAGSANSLLKAVDNVIDFAKIETGSMEFEKNPFRLDDVLNELAEFFKDICRKKGIEFIFSVPPEIPQELVGDRKRFIQILKSILGNSFKFTESGEVLLGCVLESKSQNKVRLKFVARDTGIGMTPEQLAEVFTPVSAAFLQAEDGRKPGVSLIIIRKLVKLMGGDLVLRSVYGRGTSVHFALDFTFYAQNEDMLKRQIFSKTMNLNALIIEDSSDSRMAFYDMLKPWFFKVESAESAQEGLQRVEDMFRAGSVYHLIIIDQTLPDMPGLDVVRAILDGKFVNQHPVIILAASEAAFGKDDLDSYGLDGVLIKPVSSSALVDAVSRAFSRSSSRSTASAGYSPA